MGKIAANVVRAYLDEFDVSGYINSVALDLKQETAKVDCLSDTGPRRVVGNYDHSFDWTGFFDGASGAFDSQAFTDFRSDEDHYLSTVFGTSENSPAYLDIVRTMEQPRSAQLGGAVLLNLKGEGSGGRARGVLLRSATLTGAGNGTGRNMGATTSGQVFAVHFHLFSFSGTSVTLKIQESSDDGSGDAYADIAGLTSGALSAAGIVRVTTTAATEAYKRVVASGTFSSALVIVTAGKVLGT